MVREGLRDGVEDEGEVKGAHGDAETDVVDVETGGLGVGAVVGVEPELEAGLLAEEVDFRGGEDVEGAVPGKAGGKIVVGVAGAQEFEEGGAVGSAEPGAQVVAAGVGGVVAEVAVVVFDVNVEGEGSEAGIGGEGEQTGGAALLGGAPGQEEGVGAAVSDGVGDGGSASEYPGAGELEITCGGDVFAEWGPDAGGGPGGVEAGEGAGVGGRGLQGGEGVDAAAAVGFVFAGGAEIGGSVLDDVADLCGAKGGVAGEDEGGEPGHVGCGHAGAAHGAVATAHAQGPDHKSGGDDIDEVAAVGEAGKGIGSGGGADGDGVGVSSGPVVDFAAVVAGGGDNYDAVLDGVGDGVLFATAVGCAAQAKIDDLGAVVNGVEDGFDFVGVGAKAGRGKDAEGHKPHFGGDAGDAFAVVYAGTDDAGNVAAVAIPVVDVAVIGSEVPAVDVIDEAVVVVVDVVAGCFARIGPQGAFEVFVDKVDATVDDGDDDLGSAEGDVPGLADADAVEIAAVGNAVVGGVVLVVGVVGSEVGSEKVVGFGEGDGGMAVEGGEYGGEVAGNTIAGELKSGNGGEEDAGRGQETEAGRGRGEILRLGGAEEDFVGSVRLGKGGTPGGNVGGGGRRGRGGAGGIWGDEDDEGDEEQGKGYFFHEPGADLGAVGAGRL